MQQCSMKSMVKEVYSLDPDIDRENFEDKRQIARLNVQPDNNRDFYQFPRLVSHLRLRQPELYCHLWIGTRRIPSQVWQIPLLFQSNTTMGCRDEEIPRYAGREATRPSIRHRASYANGLQIVPNGRSCDDRRLGDKHGVDRCVRHEAGTVRLVQ